MCRYVSMKDGPIYWHVTTNISFQHIFNIGAVLSLRRLRRCKIPYYRRNRYSPKQIAAKLDTYVYLSLAIDPAFVRWRMQRGVNLIKLGFSAATVRLPGANVFVGNGLRFAHRDAFIGGRVRQCYDMGEYPPIVAIDDAIPLFPWLLCVEPLV